MIDLEAFKNKIEAEVKNTVGYAEAANKASFMTGASVALIRAQIEIQKDAELNQKRLDNYKERFEEVSSDMQALVSIIDKYSQNK